MSLPAPDFGDDPAEDYAPAADLARAGDCVRVEAPGVQRWRAFVLSAEGGADLGILRECGGPASEHTVGRAWDWGRLAAVPTDRASAERVVAWLLADDAAIFRRLGLLYVIWDRRIWSARSRAWRVYTGRDPHTGHVHFSFGVNGAAGDTSFFRWLDKGAPAAPSSGGTLAAAGALCVLALVYVAARWS